MQGVGFLADLVRFQNVHHALHGLGNGVVLGKTVPLEQGIKDRSGDQVLGQHFSDLTIADAVVQIRAQLTGKGRKGFPFQGVVRALQNPGNAVDVGIGNLGNIVGPFFPVVAVPHLLDQFGIDGPFNFSDLELKFALIFVGIPLGRRFANGKTTFPRLAVGFSLGFFLLLLDFVGDGDDFHLPRITASQIRFIDHGIKTVIVRAQSL
ncbi:hypothetical protein FEMY_19970 [Ferrovum myxofaciens]|uniref:Uncharacterized protein n=1 Tax=Ferrovum myxofaciens TaxID=416213 RepID=A0A149VW65_9PROT|nr:hypothetical protein FEMY_19970 [Ferrovum myxofaciens]